ncbi:MAG: translation initiation factor IF-2 [Chloroflexi bacterium]|nr:translation initiation factor IF-2 [Chloroflexota bacterium]
MTTKESKKTLQIPSAIVVHQLAQMMDVSAIELIKQLMRNGVMVTINQAIDYDTATRAAKDMGFEIKPLIESRGKRPGPLIVADETEEASQLVSRAPVVTILGHVDHGKTTILDAIRKSNVTATEVGGITQHIGAYQAEYNGQPITFLDTPGHEAFTAMRARGAQATDIAVLVVAADDGVMPQTIEAINHAKAAGVPIVVAINKMDKPGVDAERVKRQLAEQSLLIEEWGGDVICVSISAKEKTGIDDLLENILVVSEVAELKANPSRPAIGVVVEARLDKSKGPLVTALVQTGTLRVGDYLVVGDTRGRVKALINDKGRRIKQAGPSTPVEVLGLERLPASGDTLTVVPSEQISREMLTQRLKEVETRVSRALSLEDVASQIQAGEFEELNLIIKTDVHGSIDALQSSLERLSTEKTKIRFVHTGAGSITESDVLLATASRAVIIGFNTRPEPGAKHLAEQQRIDIRFYDIIYNAIDDVQKALQGLLQRPLQDVVEGHAEVRAVFSVGKGTKIAGSYVKDGRITRSSLVRVLRKGVVVFEGVVSSLKHFKDDVREMTAGYECGIGVQGFTNFQEGDIVEAHHTE